MSAGYESLLWLFAHPQRPVFLLTDENQQKLFNMPSSFLNKRIKEAISNKSDDDNLAARNIKDIKSLPDLGLATTISRYENFSIFWPKHSKAAATLIQIFMDSESCEDLMANAAYARDRVNSYLFNYALSVAIIHRHDTKKLAVPSLIHIFPGKFVDGIVLKKVVEEINIFEEKHRETIKIPKDYTATNLDPEHHLAYFREDLGVNLHHWHWHLVYPHSGTLHVVQKDRRGELFYFMHQQMVARYNFERFCNKFPRVERFEDWRKPIAEGYFSKLTISNANHNYAGREPNSTLRNVNREGVQVDISALERWRDRIFHAIHKKEIPTVRREDNGMENGIDELGNIIEASDLSIDKYFYGNLHNMLHDFIGVIHDPDGRYLEYSGVIGDTATAVRDPVFFRLHAFIDDIFQTYKNTLPPYTAEQLKFEGVTVQKVEVDVEGIADKEIHKNTFHTFWQESKIDISHGLDFGPNGKLNIQFTHLQHTLFTYRINVDNSNEIELNGTCRIFLAPKYDEKGTEWLLKDQRLMFVELDKFKVTLKKGLNKIERKSSESNVTIPFEQTFKGLDINIPDNCPKDDKDIFNYCGCGWPDHMLLPKGTHAEFNCELFVMISKYDEDMVDQQRNEKDCCDNAFSYCGLRGLPYPDKRAMGFPFDRAPSEAVQKSQDFLLPNMRLTEVMIKFTDKILPAPNKQ